MKLHIIADLDGTISLDGWRRELIKTQNVEAYFAACGDDPTNEAVVELLQRLMPFYDIHIITGRSESVRGETEDWLVTHGVPYDTLNMRSVDLYDPSGTDHTAFKSDDDLKRDLYKQLGLSPDNTLCVLEDREEMVDFWRKEGFEAWQVKPRGVFY